MSMKVGIQLFSVKNEMAKNPLACIEQVARTGYKYIETANHRADQDCGCGFGVPANEFKAKLDEYGAQVVSGHIFPMREDNIGPILDYYNVLGAKLLVNPMNVFRDKDEVLSYCDSYNRVGKKITEGGLRFCYHNHFHEFQLMDGQPVLDIIMENTDPAYVGLELDTYWVVRGGEDPLKYINKYASRLLAIHQKDLAKDFNGEVNQLKGVQDRVIDHNVFHEVVGDRLEIVEIGTGQLDIQGIIDAGNATGNTEFIILEQDATRYPEMESIRISMDAFRKFKGIEWA